MLTVPGFDQYADGAAAAADLSARLTAACQAVAATAAGVTDVDARAPSLLPGWTRGHVLTHLARNADGLRNLLSWARTGIETPQYASAAERDAAIAAGRRPAAELRADVEAADAAFAAEAASLRAADWDAQVHGLRGQIIRPGTRCGGGSARSRYTTSISAPATVRRTGRTPSPGRA